MIFSKFLAAATCLHPLFYVLSLVFKIVMSHWKEIPDLVQAVSNFFMLSLPSTCRFGNVLIFRCSNLPFPLFGRITGVWDLDYSDAMPLFPAAARHNKAQPQSNVCYLGVLMTRIRMIGQGEVQDCWRSDNNCHQTVLERQR